MTSSRGLRRVLIGLLLLSLGLKLIWAREAPAPDGALFTGQAEALLRGQGFATARLTRPFGTLLFARKGACMMMAGDYPPDGLLDDAFHWHSRAIGPLHFMWRGESYERLPKFRALADFLLRRELGRIGFAPARLPVVAYAASPACGAAPVDWTPLETLPR